MAPHDILLLVAGILAHTILEQEAFSAAAPFLNTQIAKTPQPLKASERHQRVCDGGAENPEAPQKIQKNSRKPAALDPPNNVPSGPLGPPGPPGPEGMSRKASSGPVLAF